MDLSLSNNKAAYWKTGLLYLFSQETPSISMLWERERDWDCVSRLLEGELLRELTPSLLWLRWATPNQKRHERWSLTWDNVKAICNGNRKHTESAFTQSLQLATEDFLSEYYTEGWRNIKIIGMLARNHNLSTDITWGQLQSYVWYLKLTHHLLFH